jgi:hypothetical protein
MRRKFWFILVVLFVLSAALSISPMSRVAAAEEKIYLQFESVKFFEGPYTAPPEAQRQYLNRFPKSTTRYIFFNVGAKNLLYRSRTQRPLVIGRFYKPDGSFMGDGTVNVDISSEWESTNLWGGWGWNDPGNWPIGNYRVEIWFGNSKVGEGYFSIYDDRTSTSTTTTTTAPTPEEKTYLEFESVKLYEGGSEDVPESQRQYKNDFPISKTRYIYYFVGAKNLLYKSRSQKPLVRGKYYYPDGSYMGEAKVNVEIPPDWSETDLWSAWGWDQPGNWSLGTYRLEIFFGNAKVGETKFTIFDDRK